MEKIEGRGGRVIFMIILAAGVFYALSWLLGPRLLGPMVDVPEEGSEEVAATGETTPEREKLSQIGAVLQLATMGRHGQFPEKLTDAFAAEELQAPQDPEPDSPLDYEYVSGLSTSSPGRTILVYERAGLQDEGRHVLYVDGSIGFLSEEEFRKGGMMPQTVQ